MPTTVIANIELSLTLDTVEYQCQVIDAEVALPGVATGDSTEVACPGGIVSEPGTTSNGALTGNVFADGADTGITWILATAFQAQAELDYSVTYWADQANTVAITFTGKAKVNSFRLPFAKPGNAKHPLDLALITAVMSRPAAA